MRAKPLLTLLNSVNIQTLYPNEILVVDSSTNTETEEILNQNFFKMLKFLLI